MVPRKDFLGEVVTFQWQFYNFPVLLGGRGRMKSAGHEMRQDTVLKSLATCDNITPRSSWCEEG